jgi:hypothetical protein
MINKRPGIILLLILVLAGNNLRSQVNDAQLWLSANLEKKVTPVFSVLFTEEVRLDENITEVGTTYSDIGITYRFLKKFKAGASYRFTSKRRLDDTYAKFNSWYVEGYYREKFKPVSLIFRARYQSRYAEAFSSEKAAIPRNHFRTKLTVKYDLHRKFEPYVYAETFFRLGTPMQSFDQLRLCAGIEYSFNRMHMVDVHYLFCREYNAVNPETDYIVGLSYYLTF